MQSGRARRADDRFGFTIVELLVTISIIGLLSTLSVVAVSRARLAAREAVAKGEVKQLAEAINILGSDTGKWPNGCPLEGVANPEVNLNTTQGGLIPSPVVGDQGGGCFWTAGDVANWRGPYILSATDPWGNPYWFDPDYVPYQNCASQQSLGTAPAVVSFGPNGNGLNVYDCDDIFFILR